MGRRGWGGQEGVEELPIDEKRHTLGLCHQITTSSAEKAEDRQLCGLKKLENLAAKSLRLYVGNTALNKTYLSFQLT